MNKISETKIDKYGLLPLVIMLIAVVYLVVGLAEVDIGIFAGDIGLLVTAVLFAQETKKVMRTKNSKELLSHESPLDWLKASTKYFVFSVLASLAYGFVSLTNIGLGYIWLIDFALIFSVIFFLLGLLYTVRIIWFIIDPASKANIFAGKFMETTRWVGLRAVIMFGLLFLEFANALFFRFLIPLIYAKVTLPAIVFLLSLIASFISFLPLGYFYIFRINKPFRIREYVSAFGYFSPWIVLIVFGLLTRIGITIQV